MPWAACRQECEPLFTQNGGFYLFDFNSVKGSKFETSFINFLYLTS